LDEVLLRLLILGFRRQLKNSTHQEDIINNQECEGSRKQESHHAQKLLTFLWSILQWVKYHIVESDCSTESDLKYKEKIKKMFIEDIICKYLKYLKIFMLIVAFLTFVFIIIDVIADNKTEEHTSLKMGQSVVFLICLGIAFYLMNYHPELTPMVISFFIWFFMTFYGYILTVNDVYEFDELFITTMA